MTPTRPSTIAPRDWDAMSWHQRDKAARTAAKERAARMAILEQERPEKRPPEIVYGWFTPLVAPAIKSRGAMRVLIGLLDQELTRTREDGLTHHGTQVARQRHRNRGEAYCAACEPTYQPVTDDEHEEMRHLAAQGMPRTRIAQELGRHKTTVGKHLKGHAA